jgi:hypothetical protein
MSDYIQITNFSAKDALTSGDPEKIILGADVDAELEAIETAIATKPDESTTPTLAGNTFTATQIVSSILPRVRLNETDQAADKKLWEIQVNGSDFKILTMTDAAVAGEELLKGVRGTGTDITSVELLGQVISSGTYTPTPATYSNASSFVPNGVAMYMRIGNTVHVSFSGVVDFGGAGAASFHIDLPVASNFGDDGDAGGSASWFFNSTNHGGGRVTASAANNDAIISFGTGGAVASANIGVSFAYKVI